MEGTLGWLIACWKLLVLVIWPSLCRFELKLTLAFLPRFPRPLALLRPPHPSSSATATATISAAAATTRKHSIALSPWRCRTLGTPGSCRSAGTPGPDS